MTIEYGDFERVDVRVGTITAVDDFPRARNPTYRLTVDLGPELGERRSSAQVTMSEVLVLGVPTPRGRDRAPDAHAPRPERGRRLLTAHRCPVKLMTCWIPLGRLV